MATFEGWPSLGGGSGSGTGLSTELANAMGLGNAGESSGIKQISIDAPKIPTFGGSGGSGKAQSLTKTEREALRREQEEAQIQANAQNYLTYFKNNHPTDSTSVQKQEEDLDELIKNGIDADLATNPNFVASPELAQRQKTAIQSALSAYVKAQSKAVADNSSLAVAADATAKGIDNTYDMGLIVGDMALGKKEQEQLKTVDQELQRNQNEFYQKRAITESLINPNATPEVREKVEQNLLAPEFAQFADKQNALNNRKSRLQIQSDANQFLRSLAIIDAVEKSDANEKARIKDDPAYKEIRLRQQELQNDPDYDYMVGLAKNNHKFLHVASMALENAPQLVASVGAGIAGTAAGGTAGATLAMALMNYGQSLGGIGQQVVQSMIDADQKQLDGLAEYQKLKQYAIDQGQDKDKADKFARVSLGMQAAGERTGAALAPAVVSAVLGPEALLAKGGFLNKLVNGGIVKKSLVNRGAASGAASATSATTGSAAAGTAGATAAQTAVNQSATAIARSSVAPVSKLKQLEQFLIQKTHLPQVAGIGVSALGEGMDEVTENAASIHIVNQALHDDKSLLDGWESNFALGALLGGVYGLPALRHKGRQSETEGAPQDVSFDNNQSSTSTGGTASTNATSTATTSGLAGASPEDLVRASPAYRSLRDKADQDAMVQYGKDFNTATTSILNQQGNVNDSNVDGALAAQLDDAIEGIIRLFPDGGKQVDNMLDRINQAGTVANGKNQRTVSLTRDGIRQRADAYRKANTQQNTQAQAQPNVTQANTQQNQPTTVGAPQDVTMGTGVNANPSTGTSVQVRQGETNVSGADVNQASHSANEQSGMDNILAQQTQQNTQAQQNIAMQQAQQTQPAQYPSVVSAGDVNANERTDQGLSPANSSAAGTQQGSANATGQQNTQQIAGSYQTAESTGAGWSPYENAGETSSDVQSAQSTDWWSGEGANSGRSGAELASSGAQSDLGTGSTASQTEQRSGNSANAEAISPDDAQRVAVDTARVEAYREIRRDIEREQAQYDATVISAYNKLKPQQATDSDLSPEQRACVDAQARVEAHLFANIQATLRSVFEASANADVALTEFFSPDIRRYQKTDTSDTTIGDFDPATNTISYSYAAPFNATHEILHATLLFIRRNRIAIATAAETNPQAKRLIEAVDNIAKSLGISVDDFLDGNMLQIVANGEGAHVIDLEEGIANAFRTYIRNNWASRAGQEAGVNNPATVRALSRVISSAVYYVYNTAVTMAAKYVDALKACLQNSPAFARRIRKALESYNANNNNKPTNDTERIAFVGRVAALIDTAHQANASVALTSIERAYDVPSVLAEEHIDPAIKAFFDLITEGVPTYQQEQYSSAADARLITRATYDVATAHRAASYEAQGLSGAEAARRAHLDVLTVMRNNDAELYATHVAQEASERASVILDNVANDPAVSATIDNHVQAHPNERAKATVVGLVQSSVARLIKHNLPAAWGNAAIHWDSKNLDVSTKDLEHKAIDSVYAAVYKDFINGKFGQYLTDADRANPDIVALANASRAYDAQADMGKYQQAVRDYVGSKVAPIVRSYCRYIDPSSEFSAPMDFAGAVSTHSDNKPSAATAGMNRLQTKLYSNTVNAMRTSESFANAVAHCSPDVAIQAETDLAIIQGIQTLSANNAAPVNAGTVGLIARAIGSAKPIEMELQSATSPEIANITRAQLDEGHIAVAVAVQQAVSNFFGGINIDVNLDNSSTVLEVLSRAINDNWDTITHSKTWNGKEMRESNDLFTRSNNANGKDLRDIANWYGIATPAGNYVVPSPTLIPFGTVNSLNATDAAAVRFVELVNKLYATVEEAVRNELVQRDTVRSNLTNQRFTWSETNTRAGAQATAEHITEVCTVNGMPAPVAEAVAQSLVQRAQNINSLPVQARDEAQTVYTTNQFGQLFRAETDVSIMMTGDTGTSNYAIHLASSDLDLLLASEGILQPEVEAAMEANTPTQELIDSASNPDSIEAMPTEVQEQQARESAVNSIVEEIESAASENTESNPALDINGNEELKQWFSINGLTDADGNPQMYYLNGARLTTEPVEGGTNVQTYARATHIGTGKSIHQKKALSLFRQGKTEEAQQYLREHTKVDAVRGSDGSLYVISISSNTSWGSTDKGQVKQEAEQVVVPAANQEQVSEVEAPSTAEQQTTEGAPQDVSMNEEVEQPKPKRQPAKPVDNGTLQDLMADVNEAIAQEHDIDPATYGAWERAVVSGNDKLQEAIERKMNSAQIEQAQARYKAKREGVDYDATRIQETDVDEDSSTYIISGDKEKVEQVLNEIRNDVVEASNGTISPDAISDTLIHTIAMSFARRTKHENFGEAARAINTNMRNSSKEGISSAAIEDDAIIDQLAKAIDSYVAVALEHSREKELKPSGNIKYMRVSTAQASQQAQAQTIAQQAQAQTTATLQQQIADRIKAQHDLFERRASEYANSAERAASETVDTLPPMEAGLWHRFARRVREQVVDATAMFRSWMQLNASPVVGDAASHPAYMAFANARERVQGARIAIQERVLNPVQTFFKGIASEMGLDEVVVATELGKARTMLHIMEAAERRHMELQQNLMDAYANATIADPKKRQNAIKDAEKALKDFEDAQNGQTVHNDNTGTDDPLVPIPGGMTVAKAKAEYDALVAKYGEPRVRESVEHMGQAYDSMIQYGIDQGAYSQDDVSRFGQWQFYCPLADKANLEHGIVNDVIDISPELRDKHGVGSNLPSVDSYTALAHMSYRMANCLGTLDLGNAMVALHKRLAESYKQGTQGITASEYSIANAQGTYYNGLIIMPAAQLMAIRDNADKSYSGDLVARAGKFLENAAFYARVQEQGADANGNPAMVTRTYVVAFNQNERTNAYTHDAQGNVVNTTLAAHNEEHDALRSAFTPQKQNAVQAGVRKVTAGIASLNTTYKPFFPPVNTMRDYFERALFTAGKEYRDANGNAVPRAKIAAGFSKNMLHGPAVMKAVLTGKTDIGGELGQYLTEFKELGIMSSTSLRALLSSSDRMSYAFLQEMITRVEKGEDAKTVWKQLMKTHKKFRGMMHTYSEMWYAVPIFATYKTMRENGMGKRDAQYYATEIANMGQRGKLGNGWMSALWPFTTSIGQSAAQLADFFGLGSMAFGQGEKSKQYRRRVIKNYALTAGVALAASMLLPAIATALGDGDDEEGHKILDRIALSSFTALPLPLGEKGEYYKLPLGFGVVPLATQMAVGFDRIRRGVDSVPHVMGELICSFTNTLSPVGGPAYETRSAEDFIKKMTYTLAPAPVQGLVQLATNKDFWGNTINKGYPQADQRASDSGAVRTPGLWKDIAQGIYENTNGGIDISPESVRALASSYLQGPLQAIYAWVDNDPLVKDPMYKNTRDTLGPTLTALGATSIYSGQQNLARRDFYDFQNECNEYIRKAGLHEAIIVNNTIDPRTGKKYTAADKRYAALVMAGAPAEFAEDFARNYTMEKEMEKRAKSFRKEMEQLMASGASSDVIQQMNDERWISEQIYVESQQKLMNYNNGVYKRGTVALPDPEMVKLALATLGGE